MSLLNSFVIKKFSALCIPAFFGTGFFFVGLMNYSLLYAILLFSAGLLVGSIVGNVLLRNPFTALLEGKGLLVLNVDSTGIISPFIVNIVDSYVRGRLFGKNISDIFDRKATYQLKNPIVGKGDLKVEDEKIKIELTEEKFNQSRFALFHYPCLIWNNQIQSIVTKEFLSEQEKSSFAEHTILNLQRRMESLSNNVRDFARHVVDIGTKPVQGFFARNKWVIIILIIVCGVLGVMFIPKIISAFQGLSASSVLSSSTITPK